MAHVIRQPLIAAGHSAVCAARRRALATGLALLAGAAGWQASVVQAAEDAGLLEAQIKAAFLYKFASYVEWPETAFAQPDTPLMIAVMGADLVASELVRAVASRRVNDRDVIVKRLATGDPVAGSHILFIGSSASAQLDKLLRAARPPVLTVTESEGALAQGSVINFVVADRRVRFEISRGSASKNRLRLSSRLLAVARHVEDNP